MTFTSVPQRQLQEKFAELFQTPSRPRWFFAPGRVNLIGEHIDYNGGHVFPCALDIGSFALVGARADRRVRCASENFPATGVVEFCLDSLKREEKHGWANYPKGVLKVMAERGHGLRHGLDILFWGTIPHGAGLSSSASIEVLTATVVKALGKVSSLEGPEMALICQQAENEFIGVQCGIMDQFAIAMGKPDQAILLNCKTLSYEYAPLDLGEYRIIIANTNKQRGLAESQYNQRRADCDRALAWFQGRATLSSLCDLDTARLQELKEAMPLEYRRARHAVSENQRTLAALQALRRGELAQLGQLMNQSHRSLRDDYEVTGPELDALVGAAWNHPGCLGSRMTGAGFGGCSVSLVHRQQVDDFIQSVGADYLLSIGRKADFYCLGVGPGASEISPQSDPPEDRQ